MEKRTVVGIDPGASGGIAFYNEKAFAVKMPKTTGEINDIFKYIHELGKCIVFIEKVNHFISDDAEPGKKFGIQKMMNNYQELITLLKVNNMHYVEVYAQTWQSKLLPRKKGESKTERKNKYKEFAQSEFPDIKVNLGVSDALCILKYGMNNLNMH
jgi:hypothetical protein